MQKTFLKKKIYRKNSYLKSNIRLIEKFAIAIKFMNFQFSRKESFFFSKNLRSIFRPRSSFEKFLCIIKIFPYNN